MLSIPNPRAISRDAGDGANDDADDDVAFPPLLLAHRYLLLLPLEWLQMPVSR